MAARLFFRVGIIWSAIRNGYIIRTFYFFSLILVIFHFMVYHFSHYVLKSGNCSDISRRLVGVCLSVYLSVWVGGIHQCEAIIYAAFRRMCQQVTYEVNSLPADFLAIAT
jgi:hypothetical protein